MKKIKVILGGVAIAALTSINPAFAGGEPVPTEYKDVVVPPAPMWTGFYAGLNAGWGWGTECIKQTGSTGDTAGNGTASMQTTINAGAIPESIACDPDGFIGGGQLGYNHQSSQAVFGIEADFQGTGIEEEQTKSTSVTSYPAYTKKAKQKLDWLGTVRARLGFLPSNPWLLFVTGGFAYGQTKLSEDITNTTSCTTRFCGNKSSTEHPVGWTAGAGFEYMFAPNWSAKGEYLYYDLDDHSQRMTATSSSLSSSWVDQKADFNGHVGRVGVNYRFWP